MNSNKLFLREKGNIASNEKHLATIMNYFFINITKDLELKEENSSNAATLKDVLKVFDAHPSVGRVQRNIEINEKNFNFFLNLFSTSNRRFGAKNYFKPT